MELSFKCYGLVKKNSKIKVNLLHGVTLTLKVTDQGIKPTHVNVVQCIIAKSYYAKSFQNPSVSYGLNKLFITYDLEL